jgi:hypothetical protein
VDEQGNVYELKYRAITCVQEPGAPPMAVTFMDAQNTQAGDSTTVYMVHGDTVVFPARTSFVVFHQVGVELAAAAAKLLLQQSCCCSKAAAAAKLLLPRSAHKSSRRGPHCLQASVPQHHGTMRDVKSVYELVPPHKVPAARAAIQAQWSQQRTDRAQKLREDEALGARRPVMPLTIGFHPPHDARVAGGEPAGAG